MSIVLDMYQTVAIAVLVLMLGAFLRKKIHFLEKFCIPAPVIGGLLFAILTCILHGTGLADVSFDDTLKEVCMVLFFTSVGFQANLKVLKSGGKSMIVFLILVILLIIGQNFAALGLSNLLGLDPLIGMCTGSIPMVGGHGTAGAFGPVLEDLGVSGATTLCTAAATFGLVAGSLIGGPIGRRLIVKHDLLKTVVPEDDSLLVEEGKKHERHFSMYAHMGEINDLGGICLSLFLGIAMITLKLWQLADLALPLIIMLGGQVLLMFLYSYFVVYRIMGRDYDSAVLTAGMCGFGMGATPNAMANMQAICQRYAPSVKAYLLVPLIGSLFADFLNSITITFFINML